MDQSLVVLCIGLCLGFSSCQDAETCPSGWKSHGSYCYKVFTEGKTAHAAHRDCIRKGARLAVIADKAENKFIKMWLQEQQSRDVWIGLTDEKQEGHWVWNSTGEAAKFTDWHPGQPNNWRGRQHCVLLYAYSGFEWYDEDCSHKHDYYLCQISFARTTASPTTTEAPVSCKQSWIRHSSSFYKIHDAPNHLRRYDLAQQSCEQNGGYLAKISDEAENTFLKNELTKRGSPSSWIGLSNHRSRENFSWTKDSSSVTFNDWHSNVHKPSIYGNSECVIMSDQHNYMWNNVDCGSNSTFAYICEFDLNIYTKPVHSKLSDPRCSGLPGMTSFGRHCYWLSTGENDAWGAHRDCTDKGAQLVVIHSQAENAFLEKWLKGKGIKRAWIGLTKEPSILGSTGKPQSQEWLWKSSGKAPTYTAWSAGQPNNLDVQNCVQMDIDMNYKWNDVDCADRNSHYICQTSFLKRATTKIVPTPSNKNSAAPTSPPIANKRQMLTELLELLRKKSQDDS